MRKPKKETIIRILMIVGVCAIFFVWAFLTVIFGGFLKDIFPKINQHIGDADVGIVAELFVAVVLFFSWGIWRATGVVYKSIQRRKDEDHI